MDEPKPADKRPNWLRRLEMGIYKVVNGKDVIPEQIEQAALEAGDDAIEAAQSLQDTFSDLIEGSEILQKGGIINRAGAYVEFPNEKRSIELGLPNHNFFVKYGSRAERQDKRINPTRYAERVVGHLEAQVRNGHTPNRNYELYPLREAIQFTLEKKHGYQKGDALWKRIGELESEAVQLLQTEGETPYSALILDDVTIKRETDYGSFRFFDVELYENAPPQANT